MVQEPAQAAALPVPWGWSTQAGCRSLLGRNLLLEETHGAQRVCFQAPANVWQQLSKQEYKGDRGEQNYKPMSFFLQRLKCPSFAKAWRLSPSPLSLKEFQNL